jgi:outer membrane lipoprotein-sorting protein
MKKIFLLSVLLFSFAVAGSAQATAAKVKAAMKKFPGVSKTQMEQMITAKKVMQIALPTWLPAGFKIEEIKSRLDRGVAIEDREFVIIYSRTLANGKAQRFALEAGFDGLGDLMYDGARILTTPLGKIYLLYEPKDPDDGGEKIKNYVMTEWFRVGRTEFHYIGMYGYEEGDDDMEMISLPDTERILRSLKRL